MTKNDFFLKFWLYFFTVMNYMTNFITIYLLQMSSYAFFMALYGIMLCSPRIGCFHKETNTPVNYIVAATYGAGVFIYAFNFAIYGFLDVHIRFTYLEDKDNAKADKYHLCKLVYEIIRLALIAILVIWEFIFPGMGSAKECMASPSASNLMGGPLQADGSFMK